MAHVLLVEDNADLAETMTMLLELEGHSVDASPTAEDALGHLETRDTPDIILSDIGLPGMDGYAFARRLATHERLGRVPRVALTGFGGHSKVEDEGVFHARLVKPASFEQLQAVFDRLLVTPE